MPQFVQPQYTTSPYIFLLFPAFIMYSLGVSILIINALIAQPFLIVLSILCLFKCCNFFELADTFWSLAFTFETSFIYFWMTLMAGKIFFVSLILTCIYNFICFSHNPNLIDAAQVTSSSRWVVLIAFLFLVVSIIPTFFGNYVPLWIMYSVANLLIPSWILSDVRSERFHDHRHSKWISFYKEDEKKKGPVHAMCTLSIEFFCVALIFYEVSMIFTLHFALSPILLAVFNPAVLLMMYLQLESIDSPNTIVHIVNTYCLFFISIPLNYLRLVSQDIGDIINHHISNIFPTAPPMEDNDESERNENNSQATPPPTAPVYSGNILNPTTHIPTATPVVDPLETAVNCQGHTVLERRDDGIYNEI